MTPTVPEVRPEILAAAFDFAARCDEPKFRRFLRSIAGWTPRMGSMVCLDDDLVSVVVRRIATNGTASPCLIVIPNPLERYGFAFLLAEVSRVKREQLDDEPVLIHANATVGMVWSSLQRCGEYVPGEWFQPVMFERVR